MEKRRLKKRTKNEVAITEWFGDLGAFNENATKDIRLALSHFPQIGIRDLTDKACEIVGTKRYVSKIVPKIASLKRKSGWQPM